jgi:hypothetical protein
VSEIELLDAEPADRGWVGQDSAARDRTVDATDSARHIVDQ